MPVINSYASEEEHLLKAYDFSTALSNAMSFYLGTYYQRQLVCYYMILLVSINDAAGHAVLHCLFFTKYAKTLLLLYCCYPSQMWLESINYCHNVVGKEEGGEKASMQSERWTQ